MIKDLFIRLFLKKPNAGKIKKILEEEGFVYKQKDISQLLQGNEKGTRYASKVLIRVENNTRKKRFLKILFDGKWKTYKPFRRQVKMNIFLSESNSLYRPKINIINSFLGLPTPYAIYETLEDGDGYGFIGDWPDFYRKFDQESIEELVDTTYRFHQSGQFFSKEQLKYCLKESSDLDHYIKKFKKYLDKKIYHLPKKGKPIEKTLRELINYYLGVTDFEKKFFEKFKSNWNYVSTFSSTKKSYFVHGDLQLDNVYMHKNGSFDLLDLEWVGCADNPVTPIMIDFGNLRARGWPSKKFQKKLDQAVVDVGEKYYQDIEMVKAGLNLGKLRSSLGMSRHFLDFINTTKKDGRSEGEYHQMYSNVLASLSDALKPSF